MPPLSGISRTGGMMVVCGMDRVCDVSVGVRVTLL